MLRAFLLSIIAIVCFWAAPKGSCLGGNLCAGKEQGKEHIGDEIKLAKQSVDEEKKLVKQSVGEEIKLAKQSVGEKNGVADVSSVDAIGLGHEFVEEDVMCDAILQMLADFTPYMKANWKDLGVITSLGDSLGGFLGENSFGSNEQGVRHNADFSMVCAFLCKYARGKVALPVDAEGKMPARVDFNRNEIEPTSASSAGASWEELRRMARRSLLYALATHRANALQTCKDGKYWGSAEGDGQWGSSLWALSVAYSAFFQWDELSALQRKLVENMLVSECAYELGRKIPTGFRGDTKAEENGWEADVLAAALGLFPTNPAASKWFDRLRRFAINSYSHPSDARNRTVVDPEYDQLTVGDLYVGANLFPDWTLQNHDLFHTSYQNVVMQELGEAALALRLFQRDLHGYELWKTNALMHNNSEVMENVLGCLALADGELAMPNGNDWSMFLFDQITSYSTLACFERNPVALFLENMAFKNIRHRQRTTADGSWLLRADVGSRRMGVQAHRVMMTWLMHHLLPTADLTPATWPEIMEKYGKTVLFPSQNVVRSMSADRFACFSWSTGLKSYTGYFTSNNPEACKTVVPFRKHNTGNFLGWYEAKNLPTDAVPASSPIFQTTDNSFTVNGELLTNGGTLDHRFALCATAGNAVVYLDYITAKGMARVLTEKGGALAISSDPFTKEQRTLFHAGAAGGVTTAGTDTITIPSGWVNIDNEIGVVAMNRNVMLFGEAEPLNSIITAKLYPLYSDEERWYRNGDYVDSRCVVYYTNVDAPTTRRLAEETVSLQPKLPEGWNGVMAPDPDGRCNVLVSNFAGDRMAALEEVGFGGKAPVFSIPTLINSSKSTITLNLQKQNSFADAVHIFIEGSELVAQHDESSPEILHLQNVGKRASQPVVTMITPEGVLSNKFNVKSGESIVVRPSGGKLVRQ